MAKLLIWLDLDTVAKLYDPHSDLGESSLYKYHKTRASYIKTIIEDGPLIAMQALYLARPYCDEGLNPILIVSLYFNCVCILYSVSNLCGSRSRDGLDDKAYQKEID